PRGSLDGGAGDQGPDGRRVRLGRPGRDRVRARVRRAPQAPARGTRLHRTRIRARPRLLITRSRLRSRHSRARPRLLIAPKRPVDHATDCAGSGDSVAGRSGLVGCDTVAVWAMKAPASTTNPPAIWTGLRASPSITHAMAAAIT